MITVSNRHLKKILAKTLDVRDDITCVPTYRSTSRNIMQELKVK